MIAHTLLPNDWVGIILWKLIIVLKHSVVITSGAEAQLPVKDLVAGQFGPRVCQTLRKYQLTMTLELKHPTFEFFIDSCVSAQDMITTDRVACSDVR